MDTKEVAKEIGTEARVLRRFLRDKSSGWCTVGSGSRYDFSNDQVEEIRASFKAWQCSRPVANRGPRIDPELEQRQRDEEVWAEEAELRERRGLGPVALADLRDPRVRARVQKLAAERDRRLNERLLAAGLHITQMRRRAS